MKSFINSRFLAITQPTDSLFQTLLKEEEELFKKDINLSKLLFSQPSIEEVEQRLFTHFEEKLLNLFKARMPEAAKYVSGIKISL